MADETPRIIIAGNEYDVKGAVKVVTYKDPGGYTFYGVGGGLDDIGGQCVHPRTAKGKRLTTLEEIKEVVRMVVLHTDCTENAQICYNTLKARGLSTHFMIDWDGTIFQGADVVDQAIHAGGVNKVSVGIDLNNRLPNLIREGDKPYQSFFNGRHPEQFVKWDEYSRPKSEPMVIQGGRVQSYGYTDAQYRSLTALINRLCTELPLIERQHPMDATGQVIRQVVEGGEGLSGILAHWHLSVTRWDPGPGFDWQRMYHALRGEDNFFPLELAEGQDNRELFTEKAMAEVTDAFYLNNEGGTGGFYPMGLEQQWHGGIHLHVPQKTPVRAMLNGKLVAAHMGPPTELGSNNFVVLRHELDMPKEGDDEKDPTQLVIYSAYMHLEQADLDGEDPARTPKWLADAITAGKAQAEEEAESLEKAKKDDDDDGDRSGLGTDEQGGQMPYLKWGQGLGSLRRLEVATFDYKKNAIQVASGDPLGTVGVFGEELEQEPLLHVELFADASWKQAIDLGVHAQYWTQIQEDTTGSLHVTSEDLLAVFGVPRKVRLGDGGFLIPRRRITSGEVERFYNGSWSDVEKAYLRQSITRHVSEWSDQVDWVRALSDAQTWSDKVTDFERILRDSSQRYRNGIFSREIRKIMPLVWLTQEVAERIGLDVADWNGVLYYFHPIYFLKWLKFNSSNRLKLVSKGKTRKDLIKDFKEAKKKLEEAKKNPTLLQGPDGEELLDETFVGDFLSETENPHEILDPLRNLRSQGTWDLPLPDDE